jgi:hypothetical protein
MEGQSIEVPLPLQEKWLKVTSKIQEIKSEGLLSYGAEKLKRICLGTTKFSYLVSYTFSVDTYL